MGAALTIIAVISISVLVVRIGAVALQQTGLSAATARFQALSVFTGCGFTTSESETVVNYPVRRRIATWLMIVGNVGLVGVLSTLVVSFVGTDGSSSAIAKQLLWLIAGVLVIWLCFFNKTVDRLMSEYIGALLNKYTELGRRRYVRLLQITDGFSICEHVLTTQHLEAIESGQFRLDDAVRLVAVERLTGHADLAGTLPADLKVGDKLLIAATEQVHEKFGDA